MDNEHTPEIVINEKSYAPVGKNTIHPIIKLEVEAILDLVPGAFHQPEDLMRWIATNPYVRSVRLKTEKLHEILADNLYYDYPQEDIQEDIAAAQAERDAWNDIESRLNQEQ